MAAGDAFRTAPGVFTPPSPMGFLHTYGAHADPATALTWGLLDISVAVVVIVSLLLAVGVVVRATRAPAAAGLTQVERGGPGLNWIYIGLTLTVITLIGSLIWTVEVLAKINSPVGKPALTLEVTGHQWWWEVRYVGEQPTGGFTTANEIHIPVGAPVLIKLTSADVIHSFWAPSLTGKTDTIPGRTNITWMQASRPGVYRGQCTEYCGEEHAKMALYVVADAPAAFDAWRRNQLRPAAAASPANGDGQALFAARCGSCHAIRGTDAGGLVGPDLTHLMSRQTLASGLLPNTPSSLAGWISDPQALKPGAKMPATNLSGPQLRSVVAYLQTLK
jgi:cytochrome c oxidase subunit 2